jgi:hypothetical protein
MRSVTGTHTFVLALALALATLPGRAAAQEMPWSVSFDLGGEAALAGDLHSGGRGTVLGLPTTVEPRSYGDVYGTPFYWAAAVGYAVTPNGEIRGRFSYTKATADELRVGNVAGLDLLAAFDDYRRLGVDVGYRQYLGASGQAVRPFVGGSVGFANVDTLRSTFSVPAAGVVLADVDFLDSTAVVTFGFSGGVQFTLNDRLAVQGGVDFQWHGDLTDVDGLAGTGLEGINDETRRWSLPVTAGLTVRF